jgi:hypothetical protein
MAATAIVVVKPRSVFFLRLTASISMVFTWISSCIVSFGKLIIAKILRVFYFYPSTVVSSSILYARGRTTTIGFISSIISSLINFWLVSFVFIVALVSVLDIIAIDIRGT